MQLFSTVILFFNNKNWTPPPLVPFSAVDSYLRAYLAAFNLYFFGLIGVALTLEEFRQAAYKLYKCCVTSHMPNIPCDMHGEHSFLCIFHCLKRVLI